MTSTIEEAAAAAAEMKHKMNGDNGASAHGPEMAGPGALGYDHGVYFFQSARTREIIGLSHAQLTDKGLLTLAPLSYWQANFAKSRGGLDVTAAADALIEASVHKGPYVPEKVVTVGAFEHGGRHFFHAGDRAVDTDLVDHPLEDFHGKILERGRSVTFAGDPLTITQGNRMIEVLSILAWATPAAPLFVAGWCFLTTISGVLPWRPHLWVLGPSGTAKTTLLTRLISRALGPRGSTLFYFKGSSSEAGVRQALGPAAAGAIWDEVEADELKRSDALDGPLFFIRSASSQDDGAITKGTVSGRAQATLIRCMFLLASTTKVLRHEADQTRIVPCALRKSARGAEIGRQFRAAADALCVADFAAQLRARALKLLPLTLQTIRVFSDEVADYLGDARRGDLLGSLLAGVYMLVHDEVPTAAEAREYAEATLKHYAAEYQKEPGAAQDALETILHGTVRLPEGDRSVIELVLKALLMQDDNRSAEILRRHGIIVGRGSAVLFAVRHPKLAELAGRYRETYAQRLAEMPGMVSTPRKLEGKSMRFISVPLDMVRQHELEGKLEGGEE